MKAFTIGGLSILAVLTGLTMAIGGAVADEATAPEQRVGVPVPVAVACARGAVHPHEATPAFGPANERCARSPLSIPRSR